MRVWMDKVRIESGGGRSYCNEISRVRFSGQLLAPPVKVLKSLNHLNGEHRPQITLLETAYSHGNDW